ncbi:MAG: signal peptidase I [Phycisphaerae bacterium]|nr:signal peptidase I [Phycisphaerae bacterium]
MKGVSKGNAGKLFTKRNSGWFVGFFVDNDPYRHTKNLEMKWKKHQPSNKVKPFEANHSARSMSILIKGSFLFEFKRGKLYEKVFLKKRGDYAIWLPNVEHRGYSKTKDTIMLTLRWPSLHCDHFEVTKLRRFTNSEQGGSVDRAR